MYLMPLPMSPIQIMSNSYELMIVVVDIICSLQEATRSWDKEGAYVRIAKEEIYL